LPSPPPFLTCPSPPPPPSSQTNAKTNQQQSPALRVRAEAAGGSSSASGGQQNVSAAINRGVAAAQSAAARAQETLQKAASGDLQPIRVPMPTVSVDLTQLVTYNFAAQLALTGVSWATVFATSHVALLGGKGAAKAIAGSPPTAILLVGVLVAAYSGEGGGWRGGGGQGG